MAVCGIAVGSLIVELTSKRLLVGCKKDFLFGWLYWGKWCRGNCTLAGRVSSWLEMKERVSGCMRSHGVCTWTTCAKSIGGCYIVQHAQWSCCFAMVADFTERFK